MVGSFEYGWSSMAATGSAITDEEAGDVVFDEVLVEGGEEMAETLVGEAALAREEADEGVEYDETGVKALDGLQEVGEILWDGKRMSASGVRRRCRFLNVGEDFDAREVGT
jgi:hypothetical protein